MPQDDSFMQKVDLAKSWGYVIGTDLTELATKSDEFTQITLLRFLKELLE